MLTEIVASGERNVTFRLSGLINDAAPIEIVTKQTKLKLTGAIWLIEEKMGFHLGWDAESVLMPLESRNTMRFNQAIPCPKEWQGSLWLRPFKVTMACMAFFIVLDFDK